MVSALPAALAPRTKSMIDAIAAELPLLHRSATLTARALEIRDVQIQAQRPGSEGMQALWRMLQRADIISADRSFEDTPHPFWRPKEPWWRRNRPALLPGQPGMQDPNPPAGWFDLVPLLKPPFAEPTPESWAALLAELQEAQHFWVRGLVVFNDPIPDHTLTLRLHPANPTFELYEGSSETPKAKVSYLQKENLDAMAPAIGVAAAFVPKLVRDVVEHYLPRPTRGPTFIYPCDGFDQVVFAAPALSTHPVKVGRDRLSDARHAALVSEAVKAAAATHHVSPALLWCAAAGGISPGRGMADRLYLPVVETRREVLAALDDRSTLERLGVGPSSHGRAPPWERTRIGARFASPREYFLVLANVLEQWALAHVRHAAPKGDAIDPLSLSSAVLRRLDRERPAPDFAIGMNALPSVAEMIARAVVEEPHDTGFLAAGAAIGGVAAECDDEGGTLDGPKGWRVDPGAFALAVDALSRGPEATADLTLSLASLNMNVGDIAGALAAIALFATDAERSALAVGARGAPVSLDGLGLELDGDGMRLRRGAPPPLTPTLTHVGRGAFRRAVQGANDAAVLECFRALKALDAHWRDVVGKQGPL